MPDIKQEILVVDDEPSGAETVADFLSIEGYQSLVCTHPQEVLASFEKGREKLIRLGNQYGQCPDKKV